VRRVGNVFQVILSGGDVAKLAGLYFRNGSPLLEGDEKVINHKLAEAVKLGAGGLNIRWEGPRRTEGGRVVADLTISESGTAVKYNVYLREHDVSLEFQSTDRSRVELAARLLKLAGVSAEVKKREGEREVWYVYAYTDVLAAGHEELRKALAEIVKTALTRGWVDAGKARRWLEKLERGRVLREGWPKYGVWLTGSGALRVRFRSPNLDSIRRETQRLRGMGLVEGKHFTVKMPEGGKAGYLYIHREGLAYAA
jgi:Fe2+ transport system protein FeoA